METDGISGKFNIVSSEQVMLNYFSKTFAIVIQEDKLPTQFNFFFNQITIRENVHDAFNGSKVSNEKIKQTGFQFKFDMPQKYLVSQKESVKMNLGNY